MAIKPGTPSGATPQALLNQIEDLKKETRELLERLTILEKEHSALFGIVKNLVKQ